MVSAVRRGAAVLRHPVAHDLLWLADASALRFDGERPAWATPGCLAQAPVVVRRASPTDPDLIPVGLRGATRSQRCAAHVAASNVLRVQTPEQVLSAWLRRGLAAHRPWPCLKALGTLAPALSRGPLPWGVTGGVGYMLASGVDVLRHDSDLDLLVRAPSPGDAGALRQAAAMLEGQPARVDVQVQTSAGAFALREWMRTGGPVLFRTAHGAALCDDPWCPEARTIAA